MFSGGTGEWGSETRVSFLGMQPPSGRPQPPFRPSPRGNILAGGDPPLDMFMSSSRSAHRDPGTSPRVIRKERSNDPSEADHPMFGLRHPDRLERLKGVFGDTAYGSTFLIPPRSAYSSPRDAAPPKFRAGGTPRETTLRAFTFDANPRHTSEQAANFGWPAFISQAPVVRPKAEWVLE